jgi:hypothetical protein
VELGRFSVEYRTVFGESPSQTLHLASQTNILTVAAGTANQHDYLGLDA